MQTHVHGVFNVDYKVSCIAQIDEKQRHTGLQENDELGPVNGIR